jgi:hypothetical protein
MLPSALLQFCSHKNTLLMSMGAGDAWVHRKVANGCRTYLRPISEDEWQCPTFTNLP